MSWYGKWNGPIRGVGASEEWLFDPGMGMRPYWMKKSAVFQELQRSNPVVGLALDLRKLIWLR